MSGPAAPSGDIGPESSARPPALRQPDWLGSTSPAFKEGDVIGIALDIDGRQVYAHLNGAWQIADPAQDKGTPVLLPSIPVPLTPMVSLSRGDSIRANFGSAPFAYPQMVPPGYAPGWFTKQTSP